MSMTAPAARPANPRFSSGPCAKIPQYSLDMLADAPLGRSHRAAVGKAKLAEAIEQVVDENGPHILLIYLDVIEFQGEHIRAFYEGMAARFAAAYGPRFAQRQRSGDFGDAGASSGFTRPPPTA